MDVITIALGLAAIALIGTVISLFLLVNINKRFRNLIRTTNKQSLNEILAELLSHLKSSQQSQASLQRELQRHIEDSATNLQRVGLVRFNPYAETGGDQSFALAILDRHNNGFVVSSLHGRDQTRVFAKPIANGKGDGFELSNEELSAISRSQMLLRNQVKQQKK